MTLARIPTSTIVLLLLLKVAPPWADTWSDGAWLYKVAEFGKEWRYFNVETSLDFFVATEDCDESQYLDGDKWVNNTVHTKLQYPSSQTLRAIIMGKKDISKEVTKIMFALSKIDNKAGYTEVRCKKDYSQWAITSALPLLVCLFFTLVVWWREEERWTKVLLLPVVFIGLYSQYRAIKIILIGLGKWPNRRMEEWQEEKGRFTREMVSLEPVSEALPSLLIQLTLLSTELNALYFSKRPNPLGDNPALFLSSFGLSIMLAVMGLTHFLKEGPSPLISSSQGYLDGFISKDFGALFCATFLWFTAKCLIFSCVISSRGVKSIVGIELPMSIPVATICCASTLVLPHLLHALIVLAVSTRWNLFSLILSFPSFLITPLSTPFTYKGSCSDGKYYFRVSIKHTILNIVLTFLLASLTMVLYFYEFIWEITYRFNLTQKQINTFQTSIYHAKLSSNTLLANKAQYLFDLTTKYSQTGVIIFVILPPILLILSLLPICFLLKNCFCRDSRPGKHRGNLKFWKIGRLAWQVKPEDENDLEIVVVPGGDLEDQQATGLLENNQEEVEDNWDQENDLEMMVVPGGDLQDQQATGLLENNREEVEDNLDHKECGNELEIQNHIDLDDSLRDSTEQIN